MYISRLSLLAPGSVHKEYEALSLMGRNQQRSRDQQTTGEIEETTFRSLDICTLVTLSPRRLDTCRIARPLRHARSD